MPPLFSPHRVAFLMAAVFQIATTTRAIADEPLRWKLTVGQKLHCTRTQQRVTHTIVNGMDVEDKMTRITDMTLEVKRVGSDGTARVVQTIDRIRVKSKSARGDVDFDSSSQAPADGPAARLAASSRPMIGAKFSFNLTPAGQIGPIEVTPETQKTLDALGTPIAESLSKGMKFLVPSLPLPDQLEVGSQWTEKAEFTDPVLGTRDMETTFKYAGTESIAGHTLDRIDLKMSYTLRQPASANIQVKVSEQNRTGIIYFDRAAGHFTKRQDRETMKMTLTTGGRSVDSSMESVETVELVAAKSQ